MVATHNRARSDHLGSDQRVDGLPWLAEQIGSVGSTLAGK